MTRRSASRVRPSHSLAICGPEAHHQLQVDARREIPAFTLQHGDAGFGRGIHPGEGLADLLPHGGVHGVGLLGAIQAHRGDVIFQGDDQGFKRGCGIHDFKPFLPFPSVNGS
jgi:hypothetical protein